MHEIDDDACTDEIVAVVEQLGPLIDSDAFPLSDIDLIVASGPQTGHLGCFGGFLILKNEHRRESYIVKRSCDTWLSNHAEL